MVPAGSLESLCYTKWNFALINLFNYICTCRQFLVNVATEKKVYEEVWMQIEKNMLFDIIQRPQCYHNDLLPLACISTDNALPCWYCCPLVHKLPQ